ncbi:hypothetical protein MLD38_010254 [Melastoma candidum]|uniref:Uncharacterized protein n=1 Tax=Melastoma candidum TaxID=119954 RepID=A0ACB9R125_9MYRT|nr:hypothetical protein MLD38_010254 [Melastoma candidum]
MRIRKRPVPLPFSSLSPVPLSDPLFLSLDDPHLPPVLVQLPLLHAAKPHPQSIDSQDPRPIPNDPNQLPKEALAADCFPELRDGKAVAGDGGVASGHHTHPRVDPDNAEKPTSGSSHPAVSASLSYEENKISLKKRRLSSSGDAYDDENKMKLKTKAASLGNNSGRRKGRGVGVDGSGGTSMEGSRCSRVNGRGWRCGQQTLVGYSLCEHHLGKGRLRSMMNVRSRFTIGATEASVKGHEKLEPMDQPTGADPERSLPPGLEGRSSVGYVSNEKDDDDDEDDNSVTNRKKKARSMSSLLGQVLNHNDNTGASVVTSQVEGRCL